MAEETDVTKPLLPKTSKEAGEFDVSGITITGATAKEMFGRSPEGVPEVRLPRMVALDLDALGVHLDTKGPRSSASGSTQYTPKDLEAQPVDHLSTLLESEQMACVKCFTPPRAYFTLGVVVLYAVCLVSLGFSIGFAEASAYCFVAAGLLLKMYHRFLKIDSVKDKIIAGIDSYSVKASDFSSSKLAVFVAPLLNVAEAVKGYLGLLENFTGKMTAQLQKIEAQVMEKLNNPKVAEAIAAEHALVAKMGSSADLDGDGKSDIPDLEKVWDKCKGALTSVVDKVNDLVERADGSLALALHLVDRVEALLEDVPKLVGNTTAEVVAVIHQYGEYALYALLAVYLPLVALGLVGAYAQEPKTVPSVLLVHAETVVVALVIHVIEEWILSEKRISDMVCRYIDGELVSIQKKCINDPIKAKWEQYMGVGSAEEGEDKAKMEALEKKAEGSTTLNMKALRAEIKKSGAKYLDQYLQERIKEGKAKVQEIKTKYVGHFNQHLKLAQDTVAEVEELLKKAGMMSSIEGVLQDPMEAMEDLPDLPAALTSLW